VINLKNIQNSRVTVMGLGLNGGGLASARFLASHGANVTVTDLRDKETLAPTIEQLKDLPLRYVLGRHEEEDFRQADMVIKNPAVPASSPYLKMARQIETDISLFLSLSTNPLLAVTGTKGKSTTVSALHHIMKQSWPGCRLGGNITISPLSFLEELQDEDPVILELSSWQLADLRGKGLLHPQVAVITNLMHDHQNRYNSFQDYVDDKLEIFLGQKAEQLSLIPLEEKDRDWASSIPGKALYFSLRDNSFSQELLFGFRNDSGWFRNSEGNEEELVPANLALPGRHIRGNILTAASMARLYGASLESVQKGSSSFRGVEHRMELCRTWRGIKFYNDTAATIPDAMLAALESFPQAPLLICGGTDKELDMEPMKGKMHHAREIILLSGSATQRMQRIMDAEGISYHGPFENLQTAFETAVSLATKGDRIILSPGATSFGMFKNEFDRGNQFKALAAGLE